MKLFFLILIFSFIAGAEEQILVFGVDEDPLYKSSPGYVQLKEYFQEALKKKGITVQYLEMPAARIGYEVNDGKLDGDFLATNIIPEEFKNCFRIQYEWYQFHLSLMASLSEKKLNVKDFKNQKVCGPRKMLVDIPQYEKEMNLKLLPLNTYQSCVEMVKYGSVQYGLISTLLAKGLKEKNDPLISSVQLSEKPFLRYSVTVMLNKKHQKLEPLFSQALKDYRQNKKKYPLIEDRL